MREMAFDVVDLVVTLAILLGVVYFLMSAGSEAQSIQRELPAKQP